MKLTVDLDPRLVAYMRELAPLGIYGPTGSIQEVGAEFIRRGIEREFREPDGFLRHPPRPPRKGKP